MILVYVSCAGCLSRLPAPIATPIHYSVCIQEHGRALALGCDSTGNALHEVSVLEYHYDPGAAMPIIDEGHPSSLVHVAITILGLVHLTGAL